MRGRRSSLAACAAAVVLLLGACGGSTHDSDHDSTQDSGHGSGDAAGQDPTPAAASEAAAHGHQDKGRAAPARPLRDGERRLTLEMPEPYEPSPPTSAATDDYRCFLLDPGLEEDVFVTGTDVAPGNPEVVHHVILFRVPPERVADAEQLDKVTTGEGWTCFGDTGLETGPDLNDAPWLGAWAPGGREALMRPGYGAPLEAGSRIVMQVHYNLLAGEGEDVSATRLRVAPAGASVEPVTTMLLPAPVELPCRPGRRDNPLCDRDAAMDDVRERVGDSVTADALHLLCGTAVKPSATTRCDRRVDRPTTVLGVAGHMHLLGKQIRIEVNPGRAGARTLLDVPVWNFDDQGARAIRPARLAPGDTVRVTCRHSQQVRDEIPAFDGQPDRYVVWGEGTSDEMCLGILQVTRG